jgi:hypothetical protein
MLRPLPITHICEPSPFLESLIGQKHFYSEQAPFGSQEHAQELARCLRAITADMGGDTRYNVLYWRIRDEARQAGVLAEVGRLVSQMLAPERKVC